jgi:GxxExxY protein
MEIIHKEFSYQINGLLFEIHNKLGRFCREKQYGDALEKALKQNGIKFEREKELPLAEIDNQRTNIVDFIVDGRLLIDLKAKPMVTKDDYYQMQKYLQASGYKLGLIVNFRNIHLRPMRIVRHNS